MDKEDFILVLQASLFAFDGMDVHKISSELMISEQVAKAGVDLASYLKSIKLKNEVKINE